MHDELSHVRTVAFGHAARTSFRTVLRSLPSPYGTLDRRGNFLQGYANITLSNRFVATCQRTKVKRLLTQYAQEQAKSIGKEDETRQVIHAILLSEYGVRIVEG